MQARRSECPCLTAGTLALAHSPDCAEAVHLSAMQDLIRKTLHTRYKIERELGKGGMGAVYLATDLTLQRPVAIKVLPPELAVRPELRERFLRETRLAAAFSHPNIVAVHAVEEHPQLLCFVMGYVEGETLGQRIRRAGPLSAAEAVKMLQEVAWALSYAHGRGVVHRDIKPDNILIERATGRSLVTDFGIARSTADNGNQLTQVGEVVGTPQFMSPEQAAGDVLDGRSDLYALGVVGFLALTGKLPFEAENAGAVMAMHLTQAPPRMQSRRPDLPQALCAAIDRCLEKDPAKRFENGEALAAALDPLRQSRREISPVVRLFNQQLQQVTRTSVIVTMLTLVMAARAGGTYDRSLTVILGGAVIWGFIAQLFGRARGLLRVGFGYDEIRNGIQAIQQERLDANAAERLDPSTRTRQLRLQRLMIFSFAAGFGGYIFVFKNLRTKISDHYYSVTTPGSIIIVACTVLLGLALALLMMNPTRASAVDRLITALWSGPLGRRLFRAANWRLHRTGVTAPDGVSAGSAAASPLTIIAALPAAARRDLSDAKTQITRLTAVMIALAEREHSLEAALAEAGDTTPGTDPGLQARRLELVRDLATARVEATAKRERLAAALENVRLQLLRLKSGLGSAADVAQELSAAARIAG